MLRRVHGENFKALEGKVAIITGASNGLGLENARCTNGGLWLFCLFVSCFTWETPSDLLDFFGLELEVKG